LNISEAVTRLVEALRHELREYGELLALLEQQQEHVMVRAADDVLHSVAAIGDQAAKIQEARRLREDCQKDVARELQTPDEPSFAALMPRLPEPHRFAVAELVRENNDLLTRVQERARQNHLLMSRSLELMQRFITSLIPAIQPTVYTGSGDLHANPAPPPPLYEAVG
jgi:flagellar biosynthesis/type III secretory pathway chaperone